jgi:hypothetical protein
VNRRRLTYEDLRAEFRRQHRRNKSRRSDRGGKDSRLSIDDCQLPICEVLIVAGLQHVHKRPKRGPAHKGVKYADRTDYVHENTGSRDKMANNQSGFLP